MAENRGGMETVFHDVRPVELKLWLAINNRFFELFKGDGGIDQRTWSKAVEEEEASYRVGRYSRLPSNDLLHVIEGLRRGDMLPAIYFIFSRRGCREALQRCSYHELDLTTAAEKEAIVPAQQRRHTDSRPGHRAREDPKPRTPRSLSGNSSVSTSSNSGTGRTTS